MFVTDAQPINLSCASTLGASIHAAQHITIPLQLTTQRCPALAMVQFGVKPQHKKAPNSVICNKRQSHVHQQTVQAAPRYYLIVIRTEARIAAATLNTPA